MLTKSERRFVEDPDRFTPKQRRLYRCRINKKLRKTASDLEIIFERNDKLDLNLKMLENFSTFKELQNSEALQEKTQHTELKNSFLDKLENWQM